MDMAFCSEGRICWHSWSRRIDLIPKNRANNKELDESTLDRFRKMLETLNALLIES